ncbi:MAG: hypothetical protein VYB54_10990 [Pseudomonadota bacterium]|nr:hypothetical protein [Pseudomonadota bacterium]
MNRILALSAALAVSLVAASCGGGSSASGPCPKIGVLPDASNYTVTDASGQVRALARLDVSHAPCIYNKSRFTETGYSSVSTVLTVTVSAVRGEGSSVSSLTAPVRVATISADGVLTGQQDFDIDVSVPAGATGRDDERVEITVPYPGSGFAEQHRIVVAFRIDRNAVLVNRSRLGR